MIAWKRAREKVLSLLSLMLNCIKDLLWGDMKMIRRFEFCWETQNQSALLITLMQCQKQSGDGEVKQRQAKGNYNY